MSLRSRYSSFIFSSFIQMDEKQTSLNPSDKRDLPSVQDVNNTQHLQPNADIHNNSKYQHQQQLNTISRKRKSKLITTPFQKSKSNTSFFLSFKRIIGALFYGRNFMNFLLGFVIACSFLCFHIPSLFFIFSSSLCSVHLPFLESILLFTLKGKSPCSDTEIEFVFPHSSSLSATHSLLNFFRTNIDLQAEELWTRKIKKAKEESIQKQKVDQIGKEAIKIKDKLPESLVELDNSILFSNSHLLYGNYHADLEIQLRKSILNHFSNLELKSKNQK